MTKKVVKLIDPSTGLMECKICGRRHYAMLEHGGKYHHGAWQCLNGCKSEDE